MTDEPQRPPIKEVREGQEKDQLNPIRTPHTNATLHGPPGTEIGSLHCELAVDPSHGNEGSIVTVSAWDLDERQRDLIAAGAHVRMGVWQHPIPPLSLAIEAPFCGACAEPKVYVRAEKAFFCATEGCAGRDPRFDSTNGSGSPPESEGEATDEDGRSTSRRALDAAHGDFEPASRDDAEVDGEESSPLD